jgi:hypothetical protein
MYLSLYTCVQQSSIRAGEGPLSPAERGREQKSGCTGFYYNIDAYLFGAFM